MHFIYLFFRERGREREREGEKHQCVVTSHVPLTGYMARNPGMCPDWESKPQPFGSQAQAQSSEIHQPRLILFYHYFFVLLMFLFSFLEITIMHVRSLLFFIIKIFSPDILSSV